MKSRALQELVNKVFNDEKTKLEFESNPETVLSRFNLTEQEKKAILTTHAKLGFVTSDSSALEAVLTPTASWYVSPP